VVREDKAADQLVAACTVVDMPVKEWQEQQGTETPKKKTKKKTTSKKKTANKTSKKTATKKSSSKS
jgi:carbohydrate-binding DOMON domain-containing protein